MPTPAASRQPDSPLAPRPEPVLRKQLAGLYRLLAHLRMTDLIFTHVSVRVPGPEHHFLINPYGMLFSEIRASDLIKIDLDGNPVASQDPPRHAYAVNPAGFTIHSAIHAARPDLNCIVHTHTAAGMGVAAQRDGLLFITQHAMKFHGRLAYHEYEGIATDLSERERLVADLGPHKAMILRNHGLLAAGRTVPEAFDQIYFLERACQAQIAAQSGGAALSFPGEAVRTHTASQFRGDDYPPWIELAWEAALRMVADQKEDYES